MDKILRNNITTYIVGNNSYDNLTDAMKAKSNNVNPKWGKFKQMVKFYPNKFRISVSYNEHLGTKFTLEEKICDTFSFKICGISPIWKYIDSYYTK